VGESPEAAAVNLGANAMQIGLVSAPQHESLIDLLCELYGYYNKASTVTREVVRTHLLENLLASDSPLRLVVASHPQRGVVGFAAIALLYSLVDPTPENRRQCLLKELYVRSTERSLGVGRALMAWSARYAVDHGCGRMDWNVKASNHEGRAFYEGLGAENVDDRLSYRLARPSLVRLAGTGRAS
jgi:GNAT superfamily N-acetyltransferase